MAELLGKNYNAWEFLEKIPLNHEDELTSDEWWPCAWCYCYNKHCPQSLKLPNMFFFNQKIIAEQVYTQPLEKAFDKIGENILLLLVTTLVSIKEEIKGSSFLSSS